MEGSVKLALNRTVLNATILDNAQNATLGTH